MSGQSAPAKCLASRHIFWRGATGAGGFGGDIPIVCTTFYGSVSLARAVAL